MHDSPRSIEMMHLLFSWKSRKKLALLQKKKSEEVDLELKIKKFHPQLLSQHGQVLKKIYHLDDNEQTSSCVTHGWKSPPKKPLKKIGILLFVSLFSYF